MTIFVVPVKRNKLIQSKILVRVLIRRKVEWMRKGAKIMERNAF